MTGKSEALLAAQRFWNLLGRPDEFRDAAPGWEPAMRNLMDDAGFDLSGVREFLKWCLKVNDFSAKYLREARDPMACLRKNQGSLLKRFNAYEASKPAAVVPLNPAAMEPWDGHTKHQIAVVWGYCFYYAGTCKGTDDLWYREHVHDEAFFKKKFPEMLAKVPPKWRAPKKHVPDPACLKCGGTGRTLDVEHDYHGRKGFDLQRHVGCPCGKDVLMTREELLQ